MQYFPVFLQLAGRPVVVFGGGAVAERKVKSLLQAGAEVTVVAPQLTKNLTAWAHDKRIKHRRRRYRPEDLTGFILVFAATNDEPTNARIAQEAEKLNLWVNVADRPQLCSFILPSVLTRGDLQVAVSTSGKSPALARKIREDLEAYWGPEYEEYLQIMAEVRERALAEIPDESRRMILWETLLSSELLKWLRTGERLKAEAWVEQIFKEAAASQVVDS
jgi:siroheme synthase-like protein